MSISGISSALSAYAGQDTSVYGLTPFSSIEKKQEFSDEKNSTPNLKSNDIEDTATISDEAKSLLESEQNQKAEKTNKSDTKSDDKLTSEEQEEIAKLKARDTEVKAHEQAHMAAAAGINASAPNYEYQTGPDGKQYATGGEVSLSFSMSNDPEENIQNAETMRAAALAPSQPSGQDYAVAASAEKIIAEAKMQRAEQKQKETSSTDTISPTDNTTSTEQASNSTTTNTSSTAMKMISV